MAFGEYCNDQAALEVTYSEGAWIESLPGHLTIRGVRALPQSLHLIKSTAVSFLILSKFIIVQLFYHSTLCTHAESVAN